MTLALTALLTSSLLAAPVPVQAAGWPQFRGAHGTSHVDGLHPVEWGPERNVAWQLALPGAGWSSPVVVEGLVLVTTAVSESGAGPMGMMAGVSDPSTMGRGAAPDEELSFQIHALALEDGSAVWDREVGRLVPAYGVHASNTFATATPATDGERLFVTYGALGEVVAFDLEGQELWRVATGVYKTANDFGWGSSLLAADGHVFLQNDNEESSFLLALSAEDGSEVWRAERGQGTAWASPMLWNNEDAVDLVACGPGSVIGYAPASGEVRWQLTGIAGSFSASPGSEGDALFVGNSGPMAPGPLIAVTQGAAGERALDAEEPGYVAWVDRRGGPGFASPLAVGGNVYILGRNGTGPSSDFPGGVAQREERRCRRSFSS